MPRIYTSANDPLDFCVSCFPPDGTAEEEYGDVGDGPDGRGNCYSYEADHPPYLEDPDYTCVKCGIILGEVDN